MEEVICDEGRIGNGVVEEDNEAAPARKTMTVPAKRGVVGKFAKVGVRG